MRSLQSGLCAKVHNPDKKRNQTAPRDILMSAMTAKQNPFTHPKSAKAGLFWTAGAVLPLGALVVCAAAAPPQSASKTQSAKEQKQAITAGSGGVHMAHASPGFETEALPFVQKYCVSCHSGDMPSAGVSLGEYKTQAQALKARTTWDKVAETVGSKHMPPEGMPQPTQAERDKLINYVQGAMSQADCRVLEPGAVTMRRLNRSEYNNSVRDLLGVDARPADEFPSDDVGYGFDNIGDVLSISPLLMEKYLNAARKAARAAIAAPEDRDAAQPIKYIASRFTGAGEPGEGGWTISSAGEAGVDYAFPGVGEYVLHAIAFEQHAGPDNAEMSFKVGGNVVKNVRVRAREGNAGLYEATVRIDKPGTQRVTLSFNNDYYDVDNKDEKLRGDRNLVLQSLEVIPRGVVVPRRAAPPTQARLVRVLPVNETEPAKDKATRANIAAFLPHAYRRPVTPAEVDRIARISASARKSGASFERGMQIALQAAMVSPNFLFRAEAAPEAGKTKRALTGFELASRLSYFLWSSSPDDELMRVAASGKLNTPAVLEAQAMRMMHDPKSRALADNFAGQWLQLRKLQTVTPDTEKFKTFTPDLRKAMQSETELYFNAIVNEDRSVLEFLDSDWTYMNETLARHYGNTEVMGPQFRKVKLRSGRRGGVLTQASVLTVTSNPTRTSPVKRGKWVMENILGTPPPPPPPNVAPLADDKAKKGEVLAGTLRQRLELHRKDPACASCHKRMDPIGFGMENYDPIGAWRNEDAGMAIDTSGTLPDGSKFDGPTGLKKYLVGKKGQFVHAFSERMLTYAMGRGFEGSDRCNIDAVASQVSKGNYKFSALVRAVVTSEPFRFKGNEVMDEPAPKPIPKAAVKVAH